MNDDRRDFLKGLAAGSLAISGGLISKHSARAVNSLSPIEHENRQEGTRDWLLNQTQVEPSSRYRCPTIEGYCSHASLGTGETLKIYVSTNPPSSFMIDVYRLGYYAGAGGRWLQQLGPFNGKVQADPVIGEKRLRNCQWDVTASLTIPHDWLSGVYVGKLTARPSGWQSYIIFIVRDDRPADLVFQCSDHTWQAYNRWPSQFSLYDDGEEQWYWGPQVQVSFNRPYGKYCQILDQPLSLGSGEFFLWEFPFAYWLESEGWDVTYISNQDTHANRRTLTRAKGLLSVGHDEYWSQAMYHNVQRAIAEGVSVGFFSGNAVCGRIDYDPQVRGLERVGVFGPPGGTREFAKMATLPHSRPYANELVGAHSTGPVTGGADWICTAPDHWVYRGTGMQQGDTIPGLIGWEWHGDPAAIPGLEIIATGPTQDAPGQLNGGIYTATIYPGPQDNVVFNAATCWWSVGLSEPPGYVRPKVYTTPMGVDPRVQQITRNVLHRMAGRG